MKRDAKGDRSSLRVSRGEAFASLVPPAAAILDSSGALPRPAFAAAGHALSAVRIRSAREGWPGPAAERIFAWRACSSKPTSRAAHGCLGNIVRKDLARLFCDLVLCSHRSDFEHNKHRRRHALFQILRFPTSSLKLQRTNKRYSRLCKSSRCNSSLCCSYCIA